MKLKHTSVCNQVWISFELSIRKSVDQSVWHSVDDSVIDSVWLSVNQSVENSVYPSVSRKLMKLNW